MAPQTLLLNLKGRDFISLLDWSAADLAAALDLADEMKAAWKAGGAEQPLKGKVLGMIFAKPSMRTRVSFEVGMLRLGGHAINLSQQEIGLGTRESVADVARVISRYVDAVMIRTFDHNQVIELAEHAGVPVINGLTDREHPCQALADLMTIREKKGALAGLKLAFVGDGNNVAASLLHGGAQFGMEVVVVCPPGYAPDPSVVAEAGALAAAHGGTVSVTHDLAAGLAGADVVYTDVWASMGQEQEKAQRLADFAGWTVTGDVMAMAKPDAIFMHCLPAHREEEVSAAVLDGPQSVAIDQAENRMHAQKAILALII